MFNLSKSGEMTPARFKKIKDIVRKNYDRIEVTEVPMGKKYTLDGTILDMDFRNAYLVITRDEK